MQFTVQTTDRTEVIDVTDHVENTLPEQHTGLCTIFVRHTTAALIINESEHRLLRDLTRAIEQLIPADGWEHDELDGNADAHIRTMLLSQSATIPVTNGSLDFGRWQSVLFVECDGPRTRSIDVSLH